MRRGRQLDLWCGIRRVGVFVLATLLMTLSAPAAAADTQAAASTLAKELVDGLTKTLGQAPKLLMVGELRSPQGDTIGEELATALSTAILKERGIPLVDRASAQAAIEEAMVSGGANDQALSEIAGALGASIVVVGSVDRSGGDYLVNLRGVRVQTGEALVAVKTTFRRGGGDVSKEAATLGIQLRRLSDRLARGLEALDGELRYQRVAVLPFQEVGSTTKDKELGLLVSAELNTLLRRDHNMMLVERTQVAKLMEEIALGQTGAIDEDQTAEFGRIAGAQGLVIGSVSEAGDRYLVNARVVGAEDGKVMVAEEVPLPAADLVALSSEAVVLRTRTGALYRSILLPGWGQLYNRQPVKGGAFVAAEVAALGGALTFHLRAKHFDDKYERMTTGDFDRVNERRVSNRNWRNIFLWSALAIHLINVADAFLSGTTYDSAEPGMGGSAAGWRFQVLPFVTGAP